MPDTPAPTPADHQDAVRSAFALARLYDSGDRTGWAMALASIEDAGVTLYGFSVLVSAIFSALGLEGEARREVLDGFLEDILSPVDLDGDGRSGS